MNAERLLAHYERIADAPDAIARLRRFILDLAVRGKLLPQDKADEPASELLKRLKHERARREKLSSIKRLKLSYGPIALDTDVNLPSGWAKATLGESCDLQTGATPDRSRSEFFGGSICWLVSGDINRGEIFECEGRITDAGLASSNCKVLPENCVLIALNGQGKTRATVALLRIRAACNQSLVAIIPLLESDLTPEYVHLSLKARYVPIRELTGKDERRGLNMRLLECFEIAIPPLAEQRRIVAKVDELMALCDRLEAAQASREAVRDRLAAASLARLNAPDPETFQADVRFTLDSLSVLTTRPDQIKQLRQTILNLAVRGKLTAQDSTDEPASKLLKRLMRAQIAASASEGLRARPPVAKLSRSDMWFDFPKEWALSSFDDLFVIVSGVTKGQKVAANEAIDAPYLRVANVQRGRLDLTLIKKITVRKADEERYALRLGDVLMTEGGDWDKLGRAAIWREEIPGCIHQNHIFRVRPPSSDVSSEWIIIYVNSLLGRAFFESASKQTTNLASINMTQLRGCPFPLPPLAEQHRIVAKVDALMALCGRLEASLTATAATRRRLLDALLAEALAPAADRQREAAE